MTETTSSRIVYANPWMTVHEDTIRYADGQPGLYGYVAKGDAAMVVPRTADGFWLVQEHRYPVRARRWSFPAGGWPPGKSGDAAALATAELVEETGIRAARLDFLGRLDVAHGVMNQGMAIFLATGLELGEPQREATEQDMIARHVRDDEFAAMVATGELLDAVSLAAVTLAAFRLAGTRFEVCWPSPGDQAAASG